MFSRTPITSRPARPGAPAFTLIELLVVVAIIAVLASFALGVISGGQKRAAQTRELSAARQIMAAYFAYANNNDGALLKGYDKTVGQVALPSGRTVTGIMCARYPWRLAPYIGEQIDGVFLVNDPRRNSKAMAPDSFDYQYQASLYPAFGINAYCVGGYEDGSGSFASDCVLRLGASNHVSGQLVFISARYREGKNDVSGFHTVTPPRFWRTRWTLPFDQSKDPAATGNVDFRWDKKAVCAFLDGHVEVLNETELSDMRRWSPTAADTDQPDFVVPR